MEKEKGIEKATEELELYFDFDPYVEWDPDVKEAIEEAKRKERRKNMNKEELNKLKTSDKRKEVYQV